MWGGRWPLRLAEPTIGSQREHHSRERSTRTSENNEAEFFCYDRLVAACDEALEALERARPTARCLTFHVNHFHDEEGMQLNLVEVDVPKGQVFFVTSAIPVSTIGDAGYRLLATNKQYDAEGVVVIVQGSRDSVKYDSRPGAGFTMGGGAGEKVCLHATGADFWVVAWVGDPSKIPGAS